jgi:putative peptide zinc metalloprotease protein
MEATPAAQDLEGRKRVRPRLRPNLVFAAPQARGHGRHLIKDPVSLRYFELDDRQRFVVDLFDGRHTLEQVRQAFEERFRPARVSLEELEFFAAQLLHSGLLDNQSPLAGGQLFERAQEQRRQQVRSALLNVLAIRVPVCNPDRWLDRLVPWVRFLFTLPFLVSGICLVLAALALIATHWNDVLTRLPTLRESLTLPTLLYLWVALGLLKILHEFGHGLCCKAFGGSVPEMGVLFLFFFPSLYCDATDSWMLPHRWQRIAVSAAGIGVELLVAALATLVWWATEPATPLHQLCLAVMVVASVQTVVFNANPLLRFDGYFVLSDWLDIPNLAEQASGQVRAVLLRGLGAEVPFDPWPGPARRGPMLAYALASQAYRAVVLVGALCLAHAFLQPHHLGSLAYLLGAATVASVSGPPVCQVLRRVQRQGRFPDVRLGRLALGLGALAALVVVVAAVPLPLSVQAEALVQVEPEDLQRLAVPEPGGFLREVFVHDGQLVHAGDVVAVLQNPQLEIQLRVNEADQALRLEQKTAQLTEFTDTRIPEDQAAAAVQQTEFESRALRREHATLREQQDRLTLRAPADGVVLGLRAPEEKGTWLEEGAELCRVGDSTALRAVFLVQPADHDLVAPGSPARLCVHGGGCRVLPAVVTDTAQVDARSIPPQLSSRVGGDVPTRQDPVGRSEQPAAQHYLSAVRLSRPDGTVHPGATALVKIEAGTQTLWWRLRRWLATTLSTGP